MKHTKGKWYISTRTNNELGIRNASGFIAFLPMPSAYSGQETRFFQEVKELEANAKLIAEAPETKERHDKMYEALKDIITRYPNSPWIVEKLQSLLKEIEKARFIKSGF